VIEEKVRANTEAVLAAVTSERLAPRRAAERMATERIKEAMSYRRFSAF
jgi:glutamate dehydrogenase/leucine dehydrogenase